MDRAALAAQLAEGRSIESIARETRPRRVDRRVLGQQARPDLPARAPPRRARRDRARATAGARRGRPLDPAIAGGCDVCVHDGAALAAAARDRRRRAARSHGATAPRARAETTCAIARVHGLTTVRAPRRRRTASAALVQHRAVSDRRRRVKEILVEEAGGRVRPVRFDPRSARCTSITAIRRRSRSRSPPGRHALAASDCAWRRAKCVLLCANCHAMVEAGPPNCRRATTMSAGRTTAAHGRG